MKTILLPFLGLKVRVDDLDYMEQNRYKWTARKSKRDKTYYAQRSKKVDGRWVTVTMHREILGLKPRDGMKVDHCDGDGLNNQRRNLRRKVTDCQNAWNRARPSNNSSGRTGVKWHSRTGCWEVNITVHGIRHYLGLYDDFRVACVVRRRAEKQYFGVFRRVLAGVSN